jgi:predicted nucleotidyltransferase
MPEKPVKSWTATPEKIQEMVSRIVERFDPERIILFGSHARGTGGPDSDVDLLVEMRVEGSKRQKAVEIYTVLAGIGVPKDIIVATPEEVEEYGRLVGTIIQPALAEGKVVYQRPRRAVPGSESGRGHGRACGDPGGCAELAGGPPLDSVPFGPS